MTFEKWIKQVDSILLAGLGLGYRDLRDRLWRDAYDNGQTPQDAVEDLVGSMDPEDIEETMKEELFG